MKHLFSLLLHLLFWMLCFAIGRCCFLLVNLSLIDTSPLNECLSTFCHSLRLDFSACCYLMVIPLLLLSLHWAFNKKWILGLLKCYTIIVTIIYAIIIFVDIAVYSEWANKLNYKALQYLEHPMEIVRSASGTHTWIVIAGTILFSALFIFLYLKWVISPCEKSEARKHTWITALALFLLGEPLLFVGIRGGFQQIPVSQSAVYFSKHQILNDAAVNPAWNLGHSILNFSKLNKKNPYVKMSDAQANEWVAKALSIEKDTCIHILNVNPKEINVVIILLESWSADLIESLTGEQGITPHFHELEKEGILFTHTYANGHRSQLGISAILSGFPPIPDNSITDNFEKYSKLNSLIKDLNARYHTSFYFGGDLTYGNLRAYLMSNQFDEIYAQEDFPKDLPHGKLSIFDEYSLEFHAKQIKKEKTPFFSLFFTASTHSPYDEPQKVEQIHRDVVELKYLNSAKYTDYSLKHYFNLVKQEPWYKNTLFILIADHSHQTHLKRDYFSSEYQRIPMLWLGEVIKEEYRGTKMEKYCSQIDLPKTLLNLLGFKSDHYKWSQDIFNPYAPSAIPVEIPGGLGWISPCGYIRYQGLEDRYPTIRGFSEADSLRLTDEKQTVSAYLQLLYGQYFKM
ncbi:MAG: LTA synthase family protein [Bacteroidales bacterium]|nr:LTA synthase family protein [Bacteroidales bacterium]